MTHICINAGFAEQPHLINCRISSIRFASKEEKSSSINLRSKGLQIPYASIDICPVMENAMERRELLEDVIFSNILPRLPVKALGRFTLVKKSWYVFIKSSFCIQKHLIQSNSCFGNETSAGSLLYVFLSKKNEEECGKLFTQGPIRYNCISNIKGVSFLKEASKFAVFGSCNGLLCVTQEHYRSYGRKLYLWNPIIQKFRTVSDSTCLNISHLISIALGCWYSSDENDFKVVRFMDLLQCRHVEVYSLRTGSWRKIENNSAEGIALQSRAGVFVDGCVNWLGFRHGNTLPVVVSFDTKTEVFKTSELPFMELDSLCFMDYKGSLAIFEGMDYDWSLWVQRKKGKATSEWVNLCNLISTDGIYRPVGTSLNFDILLVVDSFYLFAYDINGGMLKNIDIPVYLRDFSHCVRYKESLLLLDD